MALCQFPVNLHTIFSSTSSSSQFRRLQPLDTYLNSSFFTRRLKFHSFNHSVRFNTRELHAIGAAIDIDTHQRKTKKRKPKPGFFDEISDKWSSRISPKNKNFPWQKQQEQIQHHEEEEEDDESEENASSGYGLSGKKTDSSRRYSASDPSSYPKPSGYMSAPWVNNGSKAVKFPSSSEQEIGNSSFDNGFVVDRYRRDNIREARDSDLDDDNGQRGQRGMIDSGKEKGIWRGRKSNTIEAERVVPEHELRRLRNVALRMIERVKVGSAGITQALVEAIHEKWEVDEVVKLKFKEPFSLNMKRTHEVLEVRF